jgi:hypothetical protein
VALAELVVSLGSGVLVVGVGGRVMRTCVLVCAVGFFWRVPSPPPPL